MIFFSLRLKAETWTIMLKYLLVDVCYVAKSGPLWPNMLRQIHIYLYHQSPVSILAHKEVCTICRNSANCIPFPLNDCFNHSRRFSKLPTAQPDSRQLQSQLQPDWPPVVRKDPRTNVREINFVYLSGKGTSATAVRTATQRIKKVQLPSISWASAGPSFPLTQ